MLFSETFSLGDVSAEEWFDPFLSIDTRLFIDPFLLYDNERDGFVGSHGEIIQFFHNAFELIAKSQGDRGSSYWKRAENILLFPEVEELCLGYTNEGTGGAGSGKEVARQIASGLWAAIQQGIKDLKHFEEVQIFQEGIGPDRISDATAGILRHRLADYTSTICVQYGIPLQDIRYGRSKFDVEAGRWISGTFRLPINPYNGKPIFLVPKRYIRTLPTINPNDYWDYCFDNESATLRAMFGEDISRQVKKEEIIKLARRHPETRENYILHKEDVGTEPYDFYNDPRGVIRWYAATDAWVRQNPLAINFTDEREFSAFLTAIIGEFRNFVENNGGWELLWNENETPKQEHASQLLFLGVVKHYCKANNVDITAEANIGRGPVDFKVSSGYACRALIELKLAKNTKFWQGLERQLPKYLQAEDIKDGRFVVIAFQEKDLVRISSIGAHVRALNALTPYQIVAEIVDAQRNPLSASRL